MRVMPNGANGGGKAAGLAGRVLAVKFLGDGARLELAVEGFERRCKARVPEGGAFAKGTEVSVAVEPAGVLVFPAETGT